MGSSRHLAALLGLAGAAFACSAVTGLDEFELTGGAPSGTSVTTAGGGGPGGASSSSAGGGQAGGSGGAPPIAPFCDAADPALIACYTFEGAVVDESAQQNTTTSSGVKYATGIDGQAASLDAGSLVHIADAAWWDVEQFSVELWFRPSGLPASGTRAMLFDSDYRFGVWLDPTGGVLCGVVTAAGLVSMQGGTVALDAWTHLACAHDGATVTLYVDGAPREMQSSEPVAQSSGPSAIGSNIPSGDNYMGLIDNLRVFNAPRTPRQICEAAGGGGC
jgi:hypothetical protein